MLCKSPGAGRAFGAACRAKREGGFLKASLTGGSVPGCFGRLEPSCAIGANRLRNAVMPVACQKRIKAIGDLCCK